MCDFFSNYTCNKTITLSFLNLLHYSSPKPTFNYNQHHVNGKRGYPRSNSSGSAEAFTPQHEEIVRFLYEGEFTKNQLFKWPGFVSIFGNQYLVSIFGKWTWITNYIHKFWNFPVSLSVIELQIKFHLYVWIISYLAYSLKWTCWTESCGNALCWVVSVCIAWKYWEVLNDVRAQAEFSWCK